MAWTLEEWHHFRVRQVGFGGSLKMGPGALDRVLGLVKVPIPGHKGRNSSASWMKFGC